MHRVLRLLIFLFSFLSYFVLPSHPVVSCLFTYIWIPSIVCDKESAIHLWEWILRSCAIRLCFHSITSPRIAPHPIPSHPIPSANIEARLLVCVGWKSEATNRNINPNSITFSLSRIFPQDPSTHTPSKCSEYRIGWYLCSQEWYGLQCS